MTIEVKIIEDSIYDGKRLTTMQLRYPLFIHAQVMTHRLFSRNAASNRAIPTKKLIQRTLDDIAYPISYGENKPGMQASSILSPFKQSLLRFTWTTAAHTAGLFAKVATTIGLHKQHANRLLMPFQHIDVVLSATEWDNFFDLRIHDDAQPEILELAKKMKAALESSTPVERELHLPYVSDKERKEYSSKPNVLARISAARVARVSYLNHDQSNPSIDKDLNLAMDLWTSKHMSPFEHIAIPVKDSCKFTANYVGWIQFRHIEEGL